MNAIKPIFKVFLDNQVKLDVLDRQLDAQNGKYGELELPHAT